MKKRKKGLDVTLIMHQHINKKEIVCGSKHAVMFDHDNPKIQNAHDKTEQCQNS